MSRSSLGVEESEEEGEGEEGEGEDGEEMVVDTGDVPVSHVLDVAALPEP